MLMFLKGKINNIIQMMHYHNFICLTLKLHNEFQCISTHGIN